MMLTNSLWQHTSAKQISANNDFSPLSSKNEHDVAVMNSIFAIFQPQQKNTTFA